MMSFPEYVSSCSDSNANSEGEIDAVRVKAKRYGRITNTDSASEKTKLLSGNDVTENETNFENQADRKRKLDFRFYITMSISLIVFKGAEEMGSITFKQYVYSWCLNEVEQSQGMSSTNNTDGANNTDDCGHKGSKKTEDEAQKMASDWELYFNLLNAVLVFISVCVYGTLSDYFGRKPFLCMALLGYSIKCGIIALAIYFDLHIVWNLLAYGIDGLFGSVYAVSLFTYVCSADVTEKSGARVLVITLMETLLGVGKFTTQFGNGYFIHRYGFFYPMLTASGGSFLSFLVTWFAFKETNDSAKDMAKAAHRFPSCTTLVLRYSSFYIKHEAGKDRRVFWLCLIVFVLNEVAMQGCSDPLVLYQLGSPFCWSSEEIGWYGAMSIFIWYIVGCLSLIPLQKCLSTNVIACYGIISSMSQYIVLGLATSSLWIFLAVVFGLIKILPKPILRAFASTRASKTEQGAMFASLQSSELVCKMVSNPMSLSIYAGTLATMKGIVFFVLAGISGLGLLIMMYLTHLVKLQKKEGPFATLIQETS